MKLSMNQAAKEANKSKKTVLEALNSGRLAATKVNGRWQIEPAELFRVFPKTSAGTASETKAHPPTETEENYRELIELRVRVEEMQKRLDDKDEQLEQAYEREQKLLAAPAGGKRGLFSRWFG